MGFLKDLKRGQVAEKFVVETLKGSGIDAYPSPKKSVDLFFHLEKKFSAEVKFDIYAAKSGRVAFEVVNPLNGRLSGVFGSKSDVFFYVFCNDFYKPIPEEIFICPTSQLKKFLETKPPLRIVETAGDGNATIMLYNKIDILDVFQELTYVNKGDMWQTLQSILT